MVDKLREARQLYADMGAAAAELERAARMAAERGREIDGQLDAGVRRAQAAAAEIEAAASRARAALRWPWWAALGFTAWGAFLGALFGALARDFANMAWRAIFGP